MPKIGYQETGIPAEWALLALCVKCRSTCAIDVIQDACKCSVCRRLIVGGAEDPPNFVEDEAEGPLVLCTGCFRRDVRRVAWTTRPDEGPSDWRMIRDDDGLEAAGAR